MKKDVKDLIQQEETHLNRIYLQVISVDFKGMVEEGKILAADIHLIEELKQGFLYSRQ